MFLGFVVVARRLALQKSQAALPVKSLQVALASINKEMDADEIECILANLIFKGYIKGYISHEKRVVILSKTNPFPPLNVIKTL